MPYSAENHSTALLLGPYAGHQSWSIGNYFNFYRQGLPSLLPTWVVQAACPGNMSHFDLPLLPRTCQFRSWWDNYFAWPLRLRRLRAELFHIVDQGLAWYAGQISRGRKLITVNDLIAFMTLQKKLPLEKIPRKRQVLVKKSVEEIVKANHVISASHFTADCVVRELGVPRSKISVIPHHVDPVFSPLWSSELQESRRRWFADCEFAVIHVGKACGYKNRIGALRAFELLRSRMPGVRIYLTHGSPSSEERDFIHESGCATAVKFLPAMTRSELRTFYGAADLLIFPSLFEGFGLPPLEAMACGCPVVTTRRASLPEVVGDAALIVDDPNDHRSLAQSMERILCEASLAEDLRRRGFKQIQKFQPGRILQSVADLYQRLI